VGCFDVEFGEVGGDAGLGLGMSVKRCFSFEATMAWSSAKVTLRERSLCHASWRNGQLDC